MAETITHNDAQYALDIVKSICSQVGPGLPGTPQERERALMIKKELETHLGAENVVAEEFTFAPEAFLGSERIGALSILVAVLLNLAAGSMSARYPAASAAVSTAAVVFSIILPLLFFFQFVRAGEVVDRLFQKKTSVNIIGSLRKPGTRVVKRVLILGGHHDSAWEDTWMLLLGYGFFLVSVIFFLGMLAVPVMNFIQLVGLLSGSAAVTHAGTLGRVILVFLAVPTIIFGLFWHRVVKPGGIVPGAVDNLSACALTVAMCRFLMENPTYIPEDTEIRFISFGSEEAGLRGSRRYVARHLDELKRLNARLLNYEMVSYPEIAITTSDKNGTVKNDPEMVQGVAAAAERAGVPHKVQAASFGTATDAGPFTQAGIKALTLVPFKFPQQLVDFYHQRWDGPEKVTIEPLLNVLKLTLEWIRCGGE